MIYFAFIFFALSEVMQFAKSGFIVGNIFATISYLLMLAVAFDAIDFDRTKTRLGIVFLAFYHVVSCVALTLYFFGIEAPLYVYFVLFCLLIPFVAYVIGEKYESDSYNSNMTYLVYKRPTNAIQYMLSLLFRHHGVSMVIAGNEFKYQQGKFVERQHVYSSHKIYKQIGRVPIQKARSMVGKKWTITGNCFTTIRKLSREQGIKKLFRKRGF